MRLFSKLLSLLLLCVLVAFVTHNADMVTLNLWPFAFAPSVPLSVLALGFFVFGFLLASLSFVFSLLGHRFKERKLRKENAQLKKKLEEANPFSA